MGVKIRQAQPGDFPQLRPMFLDMGFVDDETRLEARFAQFCASPSHRLLVAQQPGGLVGYALLHDYGVHLRSGDGHRTAKLEDLYTRPDARRQGVARTQMGAVEAWALAHPVRYVFWYANDREAGPAYRAMGYSAAPSGQEGYDFFEIDLGDPALRLAHPLRGS